MCTVLGWLGMDVRQGGTRGKKALVETLNLVCYRRMFVRGGIRVF